MPDNDIILNAVVQIDEPYAVKSVDSLIKKIEPKLEKAFTINPKIIVAEFNNYLDGFKKKALDIRKGINKPEVPKFDQASLAPLRKQQEISLKTRQKLGKSSDMKIYSNLKDVLSDISRVEGIKESDISGTKYDSGMINNELAFLEKKKKKFIDAEKEINKALVTNYTEREKINAQIDTQTKKLEELKQQYKDLTTSGSMTKGEKEKASGLLQQITEQDKLVRKSQESLNRLTSTKKLTKFGKFWNRFNSYLNVRLLRNFFSAVEKGFSESLQSASKVSPELNKNLSSITSQFTILSNSVVSMFAPLLNIVEPVLKTVTSSIAKFAEGVSYLFSKLTKSATYLKVNTEYLKEFNEEMNQLSFDKFESLNGNGTENMFEEVKVSEASEDLKQRASEIASIIQAISVTIGIIGASKLITWISSGGITGLKDGLLGVNTNILKIFSSLGLMYSIYEVITSLSDLIKNWDAKSLADKIRGICKVALYGIGAILLALSYIPALGIAFKIGGLTAIASAITLDSIGVFANGGIAEQGDLFIANEAGPELVYSGPNNSSSIMNISQFRQAVVEGLYEWWSDAKYDIPEPVYGGVDGASIASSKRFIDEFNRRNAGMQIR